MTEPPPTTPSPEAAPAATPTARQQYGYGLGDEYGYSDATLAPAPATPTPAPLQIELATDGQHGTYLADADGMALYVFTRDEPGVSNCVGDCAAAWPPLTPPVGETPAAGEGVEGELDVIEREDGSLQITYEGDPLYYYVADGEPGQTNGEGLAGVWFLARP